ncbi:MAG: NUDIX hydrolase [Pseudomonadota bacterium]
MRQHIRDELLAITPFDAIESDVLSTCLAWVDSGAGLCRTAKPATPPTHLVSYFPVVDDGHILLVDHRNARLWLPPGGHVEPGEHPRDTVRRELKEELGFEAPHAIEAPLFVTATATVGLTAGHTDVSLWYVVRASRRQRIDHDDSEFASTRWFAFADVPLGRTDPHLQRFLAKLALAHPRRG